MQAAVYVQTELRKLEFEREKRDREFWTVMFGGEASQEEITLEAQERKPRLLPESDDELIARSMLGRR